MGGIFSSVWGWIISICGGLTFGAIITAIIIGGIKGGFARTIEKAGIVKTQKESAKLAAQEAVSQIKELSFKQSIQPLAESELKKITEQAQEMVKKELKEVKEEYNKLLKVLEAFAKYFDNSIGVSEEAKENMKLALASAKEMKIDTEIEQEIKIEEVIIETDKAEKNEQKIEKKNKVER